MTATPYRVALLAAALLIAAPCERAAAQEAGLANDFVPSDYNFELFEPFDIDLDNEPIVAKDGYIFRYDKLYWAPSSERVTIGSPGAVAPDFSVTPPSPALTVVNDVQDAPPQSEFGYGDRYEFGYKNKKGVSYLVTVLDGPTSFSSATFGTGVTVNFLSTVTPPVLNLSSEIPTLAVNNVLETNGIEFTKMVTLDNRNFTRANQTSNIEFGAGFRLLRIKDDFSVNGGPLFLADVDADNQIIGPQLVGKWTERRGALTFGFTGKLFAGWNIQDIGLVGNTPGNDGVMPGPNSPVVRGQQANNFAPVGEFRFDVGYNLSQAIAFRIGYTAVLIDNISRGSQVVGYNVPDLTLLRGGEDRLIYNGITFGVEAHY